MGGTHNHNGACQLVTPESMGHACGPLVRKMRILLLGRRLGGEDARGRPLRRASFGFLWGGGRMRTPPKGGSICCFFWGRCHPQIHDKPATHFVAGLDVDQAHPYRDQTCVVMAIPRHSLAISPLLKPPIKVWGCRHSLAFSSRPISLLDRAAKSDLTKPLCPIPSSPTFLPTSAHSGGGRV